MSLKIWPWIWRALNAKLLDNKVKLNRKAKPFLPTADFVKDGFVKVSLRPVLACSVLVRQALFLTLICGCDTFCERSARWLQLHNT